MCIVYVVKHFVPVNHLGNFECSRVICVLQFNYLKFLFLACVKSFSHLVAASVAITLFLAPDIAKF